MTARLSDMLKLEEEDDRSHHTVGLLVGHDVLHVTDVDLGILRATHVPEVTGGHLDMLDELDTGA